MADDEKADVGVTSAVGETKVKAHTHKAGKAAQKVKGARKAVKHKAATHATHAKADSAKEDSGASVGFPMDKALAVALIIAVLFIGYLLMQNMKGGPAGGQTGETTLTTLAAAANTGGGGEKAKLEFYIMSKCPYGTQVLDAIAPVLKKMGDSVDFKVNYIANDGGNGAFTSLHGQTEVDEDIRELCAMQYYPQSYKYMDYVECRDKDIQSTSWESCATSNGMDAAKIKACSEGAEGKSLLSASIKASEAAKASGSPTMFLNGQSYGGGRKESDFTKAICAVLSVKPAACGNLPPAVKFDIIVLNDKRCAVCDTAMLEDRLKSLFTGATIKNVDYSSVEGKKLYDDTQVQYLPAILLDDNVQKDEGYADIQNYLVKAGNLWSLRIGGAWDPYCDASNEHCNEDKCKARMSCRTEVPKKLDLFIMSQCPYGIQALNSMKEVLATFPDMDYTVGYIGGYDEATGKFNSLHGQKEVDEDLREICVQKYYKDGNKFMDYFLCRNTDMNADWQKCATDNGVDAAKIKTCSEGDEGKNLLKESFKTAEGLGISGSPTWLANNKAQFSGISADQIKTGYCQANAGTPGCEKTLSGSTGGVPSGGGCG